MIKRSDPRDWDKVRVHFFLTGCQLFSSSNYFQPGVIRITSVWMGWNSMTRMVTEYVWLEITSLHIHTVWMSWKELVMISGLQTSWLTVLMTHMTEGICGLHLSYLELWAFLSLFLYFIFHFFFISFYFISFHLILSHLISFHLVLFNLISSHLILFHFISCQLISFHFILFFFDGVYDTCDGRHMWLAPILPEIVSISFVISFYVMSFSLVSSHLILFYLLSSLVFSFHVMSSHFISFHPMSSHFVLFYFISFHFISLYFILFYFIGNLANWEHWQCARILRQENSALFSR